jgi:hypothetical protein
VTEFVSLNQNWSPSICVVCMTEFCVVWPIFLVFCNHTFVYLCMPGSNPKIVSLNASVVNFYNSTNCPECFLQQKIFSSDFKNTLAYYNAVVRLAPGQSEKYWKYRFKNLTQKLPSAHLKCLGKFFHCLPPKERLTTTKSL